MCLKYWLILNTDHRSVVTKHNGSRLTRFAAFKYRWTLLITLFCTVETYFYAPSYVPSFCYKCFVSKHINHEEIQQIIQNCWSFILFVLFPPVSLIPYIYVFLNDNVTGHIFFLRITNNLWMLDHSDYDIYFVLYFILCDTF